MVLKRVVVTGLGALTPIGNNIQEYWNGLVNGVSGAATITHYDASKHKTQFACEVKNFNIEDFIDRKEARKMDRYAQYAIVTAEEAVVDAGFDLEKLDKDRVGVIWGSGIGGLETFQNEVLNFAAGDGTPKFNPFFIPKMIGDIACGHISIKYGFRGPNFGTVSACASSTNAIIDAFNYIRLGHADVMVTGGSEAAVTIAGMGGFNAMHALSTRNDDPKTASRPMDAARDGFVLGEGAGALILEEYEHAVARGAKIYCEIGGGGMSADAHHITAPHPEGIPASEVIGDPDGTNGVILIGTKGIMTCGTYGMYPKVFKNGKQVPEAELPSKITYARVANGPAGHQTQWVEACKAGYGKMEVSSGFDYSGPFTESVLMGNIAIRTYMLREGEGRTAKYIGRQQLNWDAANMKITNFEAANQFVKREYRAGWKLDEKK